MQEGHQNVEGEKESPRQTRPFWEPVQQGRAQSIPERPLVSVDLGDQWVDTFGSQDADATWAWQSREGWRPEAAHTLLSS